MPHRIEIALKRGNHDALGARTATRIKEDLGLNVEKVKTIDVYTIDASLADEDVAKLAEALCDPIIQDWSIQKPVAKGFDWLVEVGFRPGVTDNVGRTATETANLVLGDKLPAGGLVYTARQFMINGELVRSEIETISTKLLCNPLINRHRVVDRQKFDPEIGLTIEVPKVTEDSEPMVENINLEIEDEELVKLSREKTLALTLK